MANKFADLGFLPDDKASDSFDFVREDKLKAAPPAPALPKMEPLSVPGDEFGFVPEQIKADPMNNELELTLKSQENEKKMGMLKTELLNRMKQSQAQDPKNWTLKKTQDFIKSNPPQNPKDEAISQVILDQKKLEKKSIIDEIKAKLDIFTPEEKAKMLKTVQDRTPKPGEAASAFQFLSRMVTEGPISSMTSMTPEEKNGMAKTLTSIGDTFARIPEAARAGLQAAIKKEPILKGAIRGVITPSEIQSMTSQIPYQEWEQKGIASLIPRALAQTIEDLIVYNAVYGVPAAIKNIANANRLTATRQAVSDIMPSLEKAGVSFPQGMSAEQKITAVFQAGQTNRNVGDLIAGLSKRNGLLKLLYSEKGSAIVPGFKPGEFARYQDMPYTIQKIEKGVAYLAAIGGKNLRVPVDQLKEVPMKDIQETPLKKLLRKGAEEEVGTDLDKIPESMLRKEPELWNLVQRSKELSKAADESQLEVNRDVDLVADALSLTEKQHAQKKGFRSITSKMLRKVQKLPEYSFGDITDYGRGTIIMDDFNGQVEPVIKNLVESGWVPSSNFGKPGFGGFRIFSLNKIAKNGLSVEMQLGNKQIWEKKKNYSDKIYHDNRDLIEKPKRNMTKEELDKFTAMDEASRKEWEPIYATLDMDRASMAAISSGVKRTASRTSAIVPSESTAGLQAPSSPATWTGQDLKSTIIPSSNLSTKSDIVSPPPGKSLSQKSENVKENLDFRGEKSRGQIKRMGFPEEAVGFGESANVVYKDGKPIAAYHFSDDGLDGFAIHPNFQRQGLGQEVLRELLGEGKSSVMAPNPEMLSLLEKIGSVDYNKSTQIAIVDISPDDKSILDEINSFTKKDYREYINMDARRSTGRSVIGDVENLIEEGSHLETIFKKKIAQLEGKKSYTPKKDVKGEDTFFKYEDNGTIQNMGEAEMIKMLDVLKSDERILAARMKGKTRDQMLGRDKELLENIREKLSQYRRFVEPSLKKSVDDRNLMEIENADLTLTALKKKLDVAKEEGVLEEDPDLYNMIEDEIKNREDISFFDKPLVEKVEATYDALSPEEQAKYELEIDNLRKTPEGNLLLAIDRLGGIAPHDNPKLPGSLAEEYRDLPSRVKNKNATQKLDTIVESLKDDGWFFEDSNELRAAILHAYNNPIAKVDRKSLREIIRQAEKNKKAAAQLEDMSKKRRKFITTVKKSDLAAPEVKAKIESKYDPITNQGTLDEAKALIDSDMNGALQLVNDPGAPSALSNATAQLLIIKAQNEGNFEEAIRIVEHTAMRATGAGQAIQALSMWNRLTPEGILKYAESQVRRARKEMKQPERIDYFVRKSKDLSPEEQQKLADKLGVPHIGPIVNKVLFEMAKKVQIMPEGREKQIETALMMRKIAMLIPPNLGKKLAMIQTMAQLLNPKTIIRNILGNVGFAASENISDVFGTALDIAASLFTGKRTQYTPNFMTQLEGFKKGLKEGSEEALLGVNLKDIGTRFDLPRHGVFDKGVLGSLEKTLGLVLQAPDRASFQAAFNESIRNQMVGQSLEEPTAEMIERAHHEGLYRTFQDENVISKTFVKIKKVLNAEKSFGLGDIVLKYPFTPANLLARGIEYSPFGFIQTALKLADPLMHKEFDQNGFVKATSRAFTGSALMVGLGALLASLGIITGKRSKDRDLEATRQASGLREYQINTSALKRFVMSGFDPDQAKLQEEDLLVSYDWFLPASLSISMGVNMVYDRKGRPIVDKVLDIVDKLGEATGTVADQPMVQGLQKLAQGENIFKSAIDTGKDIPASFVPTLLSQIRQLTDNIARNTKDPNYFKEAYNKAAYRVPGLASTLPPRVTPLGKNQEMYQGGTNNPFNVFLNPAFVSKYKPDPVSRMVLDIWSRTGETVQFPRQAQAKIKLGIADEVELTGEEYTTFQRYIGQRTDVLFGILSQKASFSSLDPSEKAKKLQGYLTDIYQAAKIEVLGYRPKKVPADVKAVLRMIVEDKKQIDSSGPLGFEPAGEDEFGFVPEK